MNSEYYDSEEQEMWEGPKCPACGNGPKYIGQLGKLHWWTCRACGMEHSTTAKEETCSTN